MRAPIDEVEKAPVEVISYGFDFAALGWLAEGDTLDVAEWEVSRVDGVALEDDPDPLVVEDDALEPDDDPYRALARVAAGTADVDYLLTCTATTTPGAEVAQYSLLVRVR